MTVRVCMIHGEALQWLSGATSGRSGVDTSRWTSPSDLLRLVADHEHERFRAWLAESIRASESRHQYFEAASTVPEVLECYAAPAREGQGAGDVPQAATILTLVHKDVDGEALDAPPYRDIVEHSPAGIYIIQDERFVYANPKAAEVIGYTQQEAIGLSVEKTVADESRQLVFENVRKRIAGEVEGIRYVFKALCKDGGTVDLEVHGRATQHRGRPAILGVVVDVSERKRMEEALARSEERYRRIVETAQEGIWLIDSQEVTTFVNQSMAVMLGYDREDMLGRPVTYFMDAEGRRALENNIRRTREGLPIDPEFRFLHRDGHGVWTLLATNPIRDEADRRVGSLAMVTDISERKQAETALRKSEEQYRRIVETAQEGIWLIDTETRTTFVNRRMADILGYDRNDMLGRPATDFMDEEGRIEMGRNPRRQDQGPLHFEFPFLHRDGHRVWTSMATNTIRDDSGANLGSLAMVTDISDRKQAETRLRESQRALETLISNVPGIVYRCANDPNWTMEFISDGAYELTGYRPKELLGPGAVSLTDLTESSDRDPLWEEVQEALQKREPFQLTFRLVTRDGTPKWVWERGTGVYDANGELLALEGIIFDITDRVEAEQKRQQGEDQLRLALEASSMGLWDWDLRSDIMTWTEQTATIVGADTLSDSSVVFFAALHEEDRAFVQASLDAAIHQRQPYDIEYRFRSPQRGTIWLHSKGEVLRDEQGRALRMLGNVHDVTDKKHFEQTLRLAKERAEEASRIKNSILANLSHEIRTPMTAILGFSELLTRELNPGPQRRHAEIIHGGGRRLLHLLDSIIDLARLESNRVDLRCQPHPLRNSIDTVMNLFSLQAENRGIELKADIEADLIVNTDARAEEQVLTNLLNNAIRFTPKGSISIKARTETVSEGQTRARVEVRDTGIGISDDFLPHIFDEFRQESEGFSRTHEGSGLGLSITRKLLARMNGEIRVESRKGEGTTVLVFLPTSSPGEAKEDDPMAGQGTKRALPEKKPPANILVVEDDEHCRLFFEESLSRHRVVSVTNAQDALEQARVGQFDLVFMDINLKGSEMSGDQVLPLLRAIPGYAHVPIHALTAFTMKGDKERFLDSGFDGYLAKPVEGDELRALVDAIRRSDHSTGSTPSE